MTIAISKPMVDAQKVLGKQDITIEKQNIIEALHTIAYAPQFNQKVKDDISRILKWYQSLL